MGANEHISTLEILGSISWNACKLAPRLAANAVRELVALVPSHTLGCICLQEVRSWGKLAGRVARLAMGSKEDFIG